MTKEKPICRSCPLSRHYIYFDQISLLPHKLLALVNLQDWMSYFSVGCLKCSYIRLSLTLRKAICEQTTETHEHALTLLHLLHTHILYSHICTHIKLYSLHPHSWHQSQEIDFHQHVRATLLILCL